MQDLRRWSGIFLLIAAAAGGACNGDPARGTLSPGVGGGTPGGAGGAGASSGGGARGGGGTPGGGGTHAGGGAGGNATPNTGGQGGPLSGAAAAGGSSAGGAGGGGPGCRSNADCDPTLQFCKRTGCADVTGVCATRPGMRETVYCTPPPSTALVCGCDGVTYDYDCLANAVGVNIASPGACPLPPDGGPCSTNGDCGPMFYCQKDGCAATGTCTGRPSFLSCPSESGGGEICGCDHMTYLDACEAASDGVSIDHAGACVLPAGPCTSQDDCGGASYAKVVHCIATSCGGAGLCTPVPRACSMLYLPVCGCDGETYPMDCLAQTAGVAIAYEGPCRTGAAASCDDATPCATGTACIDDPRDTCTDPSCPGVCVTSQSPCGPAAAANGDSYVLGCSQGVCAVGRATCSGVNQVCGVCVYAPSATCDADHPCASPALCVPLLTCDGGPPCPSVCARP